MTHKLLMRNPRLRYIGMLILLILLPVLLNGQDARNFTDDQGRKQGYWKKWENGELQYEGQFKDDKPYGTFTYYYPTRSVKAVMLFSQKGRIARSRMLYPGGKLMAEGRYVEMQKDSVWNFFNEQGVLVAKESWDKGVKNGLWITYYPDGQASEEIPWVNGKREGQWKQYYTDGMLKSRSIYVNDRLEGLAQFFFASGKAMMSGTYENSMKHGTWIVFKEEGQTIIQESYSKGYLVSSREITEEEKVRILRQDEEGNQYMPGRKAAYELEDPEEPE